MKKNILIIASIAFAISVVFTSCSKDETKSAKEILTTGNWYTESQSVEMTFGTITTTMTDIDACKKDDYSTFLSDGNYKVTKGTVKCDVESEAGSGTWALSDGDKSLTITDGGKSQKYSINSISDSKAVLGINTTETAQGFTVSMKGTITFIKK